MSELLLPPDRVQRRREHLMTEIVDTPTPLRRPSRRPAWIGAGIAALAVGVGGVTAVAGSPAVSRQDNGVVAIDGRALQTVFVHGNRYMTPAENARLHMPEGNVGVVNMELSCQGITLVFDTEAEQRAYQTAYQQRDPNGQNEKLAQTLANPCDAFADSPKVVPEGS